MKSRDFLLASLVIGAAFISGCNDKNSPRSNTPIVTQPVPPPGTTPLPPPPPASMSFSQFAASLIAMVMGSSGSNACFAASPADINSNTATDDMTAQDANAITVNCT